MGAKTQTESRAPETEPASFTRPFGFSERLKRPRSGLDMIPVLDLLVIALLISLLFTRFVALPGVRVDLPVTDLRMPQSGPGVAVMTVGHNGMLFFNGSVYDGASVERAFHRYVAEAGEGEKALLLKVQSSMDVQSFMDLCEAAQEAGFAQVQISGRRPELMDDPLPGGSLSEPLPEPSIVR